MFNPSGPGQRQAWLLVLVVLVTIFFREQILAPIRNYADPQLRTYHANDLKHLYLASRIVLRGENPYPYDNLRLETLEVRHPDMQTLNPYVYPPFTAYFFWWFGKLDYETAKWIWFWGSQICLLLSMLLFLSAPSGRATLGWSAVLVATVAISFPLWRSTTAGQLNHFLLLLLSLTFWLWGAGHKRAAGAVLGFAAMIKVLPAFLVVWLGWKREWPALGIAIVTILVLVLLPGLYFGLNPYFHYLSVLKDMGFGSSTWSDQGATFYVDEGNIAVPALFYRLFRENPKTTAWIDLGPTAYILSVLWALAVIGLCLACCRVQRRDEDPEMEISAWTLGMLLIPSLFWDHYIILALPAFWTLLMRLPYAGVSEAWMVGAGVLWVWANAWFLWFNPANLSGLRMLYLNASTPAVVALFLIAIWLARQSDFKITHRDRIDVGGV